MITLYQIHWSHYVEKVRWALDYKGVQWSAIEIDPFTKRQMMHLQCRTTLDTGGRILTAPVIHDDATGAVQTESSTILEYLERTYPTPALYPADERERDEVARWMLWLDSTLGLAARRLAYTQIALEHPGLLATLFLPRLVSGDGAESFKARLAGSVIGGVLTRRFRFLHNRADGVFESLEQCLLIVADRLRTRRYLVGERFTAADLTLAALLRPVSAIPYFRGYPALQPLFDWRSAQLHAHRREPQLHYEKALHEVRRRRGWALGSVSWLPEENRRNGPISSEIPHLSAARNDQQPVGRWPIITGLQAYFRLKQTCGLSPTSY